MTPAQALVVSALEAFLAEGRQRETIDSTAYSPEETVSRLEAAARPRGESAEDVCGADR